MRQRAVAALAVFVALAVAVTSGCDDAPPDTTSTEPADHGHRSRIDEFPIEYPAARLAAGDLAGSTHELVADPTGDAIWITGQNEATIVRATLDGQMDTFELPEGSGPHGIAFDEAGQLWVGLEFAGEVVRLDPQGRIVQTIDVSIQCDGCTAPLNPSPHGLAVGQDGRTLWFTGKATGTIGRITPDGAVTTLPIPTVGSVPIYIEAAADGSMWFTQLVGNAIGRITQDGELTEFRIPTANSRPISLVRDPSGDAMWFSEEAGNNVARITADGTITEFAVPMAQPNVILAALQFDDEGDLWVQQYVDQRRPGPSGEDHLVEIDGAIRSAEDGDLDGITFTFHTTPSTGTVMHRVILGPDGALWFTELATNLLGRIQPA